MSLSKKVTWLFVAVLSLSLLTVGGYGVREQESLAQDMMRDWVSQCSGRYLDVLGYSLANADFDRVITTGKNLVSDMPVAYCEILNEYGDVAFKQGFVQDSPVASMVWPIQHWDDQGVMRTVGRLTLVIAPGPMTVAVTRIGQTITLTGFGTLLIGLMLGGLAIRSMLGKPLETLVKGADRIVCEGDLNHQIQVDTEDELCVLSHAVNTLTQELRDLMHKQQTLSHCVDQEHERFLALHESLTQEEGMSTNATDAWGDMKQMVERSGGHFWIESENGKDQVFHFTLPQKTLAFDFEEKGVCK